MRLRNLSIVSLVFIPTPALATTYVCEACPAGTWGDGTNCNKCSTGTYAYAGASSCTNCLTSGVKSCDSTTGKATSCKGGFSFLSSGACSQCSAGTYSSGGTTGSCYSCSTGYYSSAGASSCSSCSSTKYEAWSGNCGTVTRNVTKYCTKAGSTSSTGNASTTTESKNMSCSGHNYCSAQTNGTCTSCSNPPTNASWNSDSGCGWSCNSGYKLSGNTCKKKQCHVYTNISNYYIDVGTTITTTATITYPTCGNNCGPGTIGPSLSGELIETCSGGSLSSSTKDNNGSATTTYKCKCDTGE